MKNFKKLIKRYANGKEICNCGEAYYSKDEDGHSICKDGCSANIINAKEYIATKIIEEFINAQATS